MSEGPDSPRLTPPRGLADEYAGSPGRPLERVARPCAIRLQAVATVHTDLAHDEVIANLRSRLDRVERRLDLTEESP